MPRNRSKRSGAPEWEQLQARLLWPEQAAYEEIRPVVAFNQPIKERAEEVGVSAKSLSRRVQLFVQHGIPGLIPNGSRRSGDQRLLPQPLREHILRLKSEYPKFTTREIASICEVKFDRKVDHHTVERVLARDRLPKLVGRRYARYYKIRDTEERREAMLRLHLVTHAEQPVAQYTVDFGPDGRTFEQIAELRAFASHQTPQPRLFDTEAMAEVEWRKVLRLPEYAPRKSIPNGAGPLQSRLFA